MVFRKGRWDKVTQICQWCSLQWLNGTSMGKGSLSPYAIHQKTNKGWWQLLSSNPACGLHKTRGGGKTWLLDEKGLWCALEEFFLCSYGARRSGEHLLVDADVCCKQEWESILQFIHSPQHSWAKLCSGLIFRQLPSKTRGRTGCLSAHMCIFSSSNLGQLPCKSAACTALLAKHNQSAIF